jgi:hypothetical protein
VCQVILVGKILELRWRLQVTTQAHYVAVMPFSASWRGEITPRTCSVSSPVFTACVHPQVGIGLR